MYYVIRTRDGIRDFYNEHDLVLGPLFKFVIAFVIFNIIQHYIGSMALLSKMSVIAGASLICAFLPYGFMALAAAAFALGNAYAASLPLCALLFICLFLVCFLYLGFKPGKSVIILLTVTAYMLHIPFVVPLIAGIAVGALSAFPVSIGVVLWTVIEYFHVNMHQLEKGSISDGTEILSSFLDIARSIAGSDTMVIMVLGFALCCAAVGIISRSSVSYARSIAVIVGALVLAVFTVMYGPLMNGVGLLTELIMLFLSFIIALFYELILYSADYKHIERVQFEDDDYYYYVKAVPKARYDEDEEGY